MTERRYDIDWVRVVATLAVFLFHSTLFFAPMGWYIQNPEQTAFPMILVGWYDMWMMPLLFLLSGFSSWYSLEKRSGGQYLWERVVRVLVPLYTVGMLVLLLPQGYFEDIATGTYQGTFWGWIPEYYAKISWPKLTNPMALFLPPVPGHLWFLEHLFLLSVLILPLLLYFKSDAGRRLVDTLSGWGTRRFGLFLFIVPLFLVRGALRAIFTGMSTWADLVTFAVFFLAGYLIAADPRFTERIKALGWTTLGLGMFAFAGEGAFVNSGYPYPGGDEIFSSPFLIFQLVMSVGTFCWVMFILSLGAKYMNANNRVLKYASEAQYPFYTMHMPFVLIIGSFVVRWDMGILPKYLIIILVSFALITLVYELLVRRFNPVRFLFGMRLKKG